jgi:hypothetical protein
MVKLHEGRIRTLVVSWRGSGDLIHGTVSFLSGILMVIESRLALRRQEPQMKSIKTAHG